MAVALWAPPDDAEGEAARRWAAERGIAVREARSVDPTLELLWIHAGDRVPATTAADDEALAQWVRDGGILACTLLATPIAQRCGAPEPAPRVVPPEVWRHADDPRWPSTFRDWPNYPHLRGLQAVGAHPLLAGLHGGTFTWMAREGDRVGRTEYQRPVWPTGAVIAVDRSYVHLDADLAVAWEFTLGRGGIRCVGANLWLTSGDPILHAQRDRVLANLLTPGWGEASPAWPGAVPRHAPVSLLPRPRPLAPFPSRADANPDLLPVARAEAPGDSLFTLGAPHGLCVGTERDGLRELWLHPLCLLDAGLELLADGEPFETESIEVDATQYVRWLRAPDGSRWCERMVGSTQHPEWGWELTPISPTRLSLGVGMVLPLRLAWPMPDTLLHPIRAEVRHESAAAAVVLAGADARHRVLILADGAAELHATPHEGAPQLRIVGEPGQGVRLRWRAFLGTQPPVHATDGTVLVEGQRQRIAALEARTPQIDAGDPALTQAMSWARVRLANLVTRTLGGHHGVVAGLGSTRPGWNRSRPGYAWFFGRDSCWCVDAFLPLGMADEARTALQLLHDTMDITGKVAHEVATSGPVHYDAADATPLFLRAVARYAAWTGDTDTLDAWWPAVERAFAFVQGCDRDGDGLPENTGVGHGWIEMGPLGGGAVTSYVAACWIDALRRLAPVARTLGREATADRLDVALAAAWRGLDALRLPDGCLALHRTHDGRLEPALTALAAVPVALDVDTSEGARSAMAALASPAFQAAWGLRMLPVDSPYYAPRAYHAGAVWPLFTGWAALADARLGERERAMTRVRSIASLVDGRNRGAFDEVLDGDMGTAAGVCSDQGWSAAAMVTGLLTGLLGLEADALGGRAAVAAQVPDGLAPSVDQLRVGGTSWSVRWLRQGDVGAVELVHRSGPPLEVVVQGQRSIRLHAGAPSSMLVLPREG